jgi:hypothetical protein
MYSLISKVLGALAAKRATNILCRPFGSQRDPPETGET